MLRDLVLYGALLAAIPSAPAVGDATCPGPDELRARLGAIDLGSTTRSSVFGSEIPERLYEQALSRVGEPATAREGERGYGVMVAELPVESLWMAINDEEHHDGGYLPVRHSEILEGTPRGESRLLFQYFQKWGIGRWWVSRVTMNKALFRESEGQLWEISWVDEMDAVDRERPPIREISEKLAAIRDSRGSWLLVPFSDRCTLIEHFNSSRIGGPASVAQRLVAGRALRRTFEGLVRMAVEHVQTPHPGARFVRPDGARLDEDRVSDSKTPE